MSPIPHVSINAAFRSSRYNEAYIFIQNMYVLVSYTPGTARCEKILNGPLLIYVGFPSLKGTPFGEHGIDGAFNLDRHEAFIFFMSHCANIDYAPHSKILKGPMSIANMFPCLKGIVFEKRLDDAFRSSVINEAYIFTGGRYARVNYIFTGGRYAPVNYASKALTYINTIRNMWSCLVGTVFEIGIEAAFTSHRTNEAYIFKGDHYARIKFTLGTRDDKIIGKINLINPTWIALGCMLERKNGS